MKVAAIHRTLVKEHSKQGKVWLREVKQLRPKHPDSKELVLVSAAPNETRHELRRLQSFRARNRRRKQHLLFTLIQRFKHQTMHLLLKQRPGCFGNPITALTSAPVVTGES